MAGYLLDGKFVNSESKSKNSNVVYTGEANTLTFTISNPGNAVTSTTWELQGVDTIPTHIPPNFNNPQGGLFYIFFETDITVAEADISSGDPDWQVKLFNDNGKIYVGFALKSGKTQEVSAGGTAVSFTMKQVTATRAKTLSLTFDGYGLDSNDLSESEASYYVPLVVEAPPDTKKKKLHLDVNLDQAYDTVKVSDNNQKYENTLILTVRNKSGKPLYEGTDPWKATPLIEVAFMEGANNVRGVIAGHTQVQGVVPFLPVDLSNRWNFNSDTAASPVAFKATPDSQTNLEILAAAGHLHSSVELQFQQIISYNEIAPDETVMFVMVSGIPGYNDEVYQLDVYKMPPPPPPKILSFNGKVVEELNKYHLVLSWECSDDTVSCTLSSNQNIPGKAATDYEVWPSQEQPLLPVYTLTAYSSAGTYATSTIYLQWTFNTANTYSTPMQPFSIALNPIYETAYVDCPGCVIELGISKLPPVCNNTYQESWHGVITMSPAGDRAYVITETGKLIILQTNPFKVLPDPGINIPGSPIVWGIDMQKQELLSNTPLKLCAANKGDESGVFVIQIEGNNVKNPIKVPVENCLPTAVVVSPDGTRAYTTDESSGLYVINLAATSPSVIDCMEEFPSDVSNGLGMSFDGNFIYACSYMNQNNAVSVFDLKQQIFYPAVATSPGSPMQVVASADGSRLYVADITGNVCVGTPLSVAGGTGT